MVIAMNRSLSALTMALNAVLIVTGARTLLMLTLCLVLFAIVVYIEYTRHWCKTRKAQQGR